MIKIGFLVVFFCISLVPCFSNDGSYQVFGSGGTLMPVKNTAISMEKELITIDVKQTSANTLAIWYACDFTFKNNSANPQKVLIGFPNKYRIFMQADFTMKGEKLEQKFVPEKRGSDVKDFTAIVDGKSVPFEKYGHTVNPTLPGAGDYDEVRAFDVEFKPGETKRIVNTYRIDQVCYTLEKLAVRYILKTGLTWNRPIGKVDIRVNLLAMQKKPRFYGITPAGSLVSKDGLTIEYHFTEYTPVDDLFIGLDIGVCYP